MRIAVGDAGVEVIEDEVEHLAGLAVEGVAEFQVVLVGHGFEYV